MAEYPEGESLKTQKYGIAFLDDLKHAKFYNLYCRSFLK